MVEVVAKREVSSSSSKRAAKAKFATVLVEVWFGLTKWLQTDGTRSWMDAIDMRLGKWAWFMVGATSRW